LIRFTAAAILSPASRRELALSPTCFRSKVVFPKGDVAVMKTANERTPALLVDNIGERRGHSSQLQPTPIVDLNRDNSGRWNRA
jgi:hypothetical protein